MVSPLGRVILSWKEGHLFGPQGLGSSTTRAELSSTASNGRVVSTVLGYVRHVRTAWYLPGYTGRREEGCIYPGSREEGTTLGRGFSLLLRVSLSLFLAQEPLS